MSTTTTKYKLVKPALTDAADITATNGNWDTIETELEKRAILENGKVPNSQLPSLDFIPMSQKGANSGVAALNSQGQIPASQLGDIGQAMTGAASTIATQNLTGGRALISAGSGKVAVSQVTSEELAYLGGVTSGVQSQIDKKLPKTGGTVSGDIVFDNKNGYRAIGKYRTIDGIDYYVNFGCGLVGGSGAAAIELQAPDGADGSQTVQARLEVRREGVAFVDATNKRTYLHRNGLTTASIE